MKKMWSNRYVDSPVRTVSSVIQKRRGYKANRHAPSRLRPGATLKCCQPAAPSAGSVPSVQPGRTRAIPGERIRTRCEGRGSNDNMQRTKTPKTSRTSGRRTGMELGPRATDHPETRGNENQNGKNQLSISLAPAEDKGRNQNGQGKAGLDGPFQP